MLVSGRNRGERKSERYRREELEEKNKWSLKSNRECIIKAHLFRI
jgi:hypothetical protein